VGEYEYSNAGDIAARSKAKRPLFNRHEQLTEVVEKPAAAPYHAMPRFCRKLTFDASAEHSLSFNLDAVKLVYLDASMGTLCSLSRNLQQAQVELLDAALLASDPPLLVTEREL
jgi:hypothetical protein